MSSYKHFTKEERHTLRSLKRAGFSNKRIALILKRPACTIGRELRRNSVAGRYLHNQADAVAMARRVVPRRPAALVGDILVLVYEKLAQKWSPEQISGWLRVHGFKNVSHECIYQYIARDRLYGGMLYKSLRRRGVKYRRFRVKEQRISDKVSIEMRPACVDSRSRVGDWEGDLIIGKNYHSAVLSMVERKTKYSLLGLLRGRKEAKPLKRKLVKMFKESGLLMRTLTVDNGPEFAEHKKISSELKAQVYFAHPYCSWERGLNENTNGLVRDFFPKGTDFRTISEEDIFRVQDMLNKRPRKTLGFLCPEEAIYIELKNREQ